MTMPPFKGSHRIFCAALLSASLLATPALAESRSNEGLIGAGSALVSLLYGPAKLLYAAGGSIVAGLAWIHSGGDGAVVGPILDASLRGDYVITPSHLRGERQIEFIGRNPQMGSLGNVSTGPPPIQSEELYRDDSYGDGF